MIGGSYDAQSQTSRILHISKPVKMLIKRVVLVVLLLATIFGIFISTNNGQIAYRLRTAVVDVLSPVLSLVAVPVEVVRGVSGYVSSYFFVHEKNSELIQVNRQLRRDLIYYAGTMRENQNLKQLLKYMRSLEYEYISASVVGNASDPFRKTILINVGSKDLVKKGQAVVNEEGLVGRVVEVGAHSSRVLLLTDINSNIPVRTNNSRENSIMSGKNDPMPDLLYVHKDSGIEAGEVVVTSGDGDMFPPGLQVGMVMVTDKGQYQVIPFVQWHKLEHLSVINYLG